MTLKPGTPPRLRRPWRRPSDGNGVALDEADPVQRPGAIAAVDATGYSRGRSSDRFGPCCTPAAPDPAQGEARR